MKIQFHSANKKQHNRPKIFMENVLDMDYDL